MRCMRSSSTSQALGFWASAPASMSGSKRHTTLSGPAASAKRLKVSMRFASNGRLGSQPSVS